MKKICLTYVLLGGVSAALAQASFSPEKCGFLDSVCEWRNKQGAGEHAKKAAREAERLEWVKRTDPNWQESERRRAEEAEISKLPEAERVRLRNERKKAEAEKKEADAASRAAENNARIKQYEEQAAERLQKKNDKDAEDALIWQQEQAKRQAVLDADHESELRRERAESAKAAAAEAVKKSKCLADYKTPQIGMDIKRWQQCVGLMHITGQINRADGVVTQYSGPDYWANVMNGRVISWGK